MSGKCRYSHPGTWGHECGKPGKWAQSRASETTANGRYWCVRCDECRSYTGPDNAGFSRSGWLPYDPQQHRNSWLQNRWPNPPVVIENAA